MKRILILAQFIYVGYACYFIAQGVTPVASFTSLTSFGTAHRRCRQYCGKICKSRRHTYSYSILVLNSAPDGMYWFVKTEQFCKPFPEVKLHLEAHRAWVRSLREQANNTEQHSVSIVSGYRVDENDKPGGGGLMIFAAKDYKAAEEFVRNDPLIINECVDWQLNKWIAETGNIRIE